MRRVTGKRSLYKLKDYKKVYVRLEAEAPIREAPLATEEKAELR